MRLVDPGDRLLVAAIEDVVHRDSAPVLVFDGGEVL
jgi:hypothetical protein